MTRRRWRFDREASGFRFEPRDCWIGCYWTWANGGGWSGRRFRDVDDPRYTPQLALWIVAVPTVALKLQWERRP